MESAKDNGKSTAGGWWAEVDAQGRLILPAELRNRYAIEPGSKLLMEETMTGLRVHQPVNRLSKVYIEPTNRCNLECRTCIRRVWNEAPGEMSAALFDRIMKGLQAFTPAVEVFFGGIGEPLSHPEIIPMVTRAKAAGARVELITNGTLLTPEISRQLIRSGLDVLWVSIDGATPESYADVRLGAALPLVISNLKTLRQEGWNAGLGPPELGLVFVAMRRNIQDLPAVIQMGHYLGIRQFLVTNVLAFTEEMAKEILYERALSDIGFRGSLKNASLRVPQMDLNPTTREALYSAVRVAQSTSYADVHLHEGKNFCPFVEKGSTIITWEGNVSPCMALARDHFSFFGGRKRFSRRHTVGNISERELPDLWNDPFYKEFRQRVQGFDFSFCSACGGCELADTNEEDCFGNTFPTCGGCLWAQGVIRCP